MFTFVKIGLFFLSTQKTGDKFKHNFKTNVGYGFFAIITPNWERKCVVDL